MTTSPGMPVVARNEERGTGQTLPQSLRREHGPVTLCFNMTLALPQGACVWSSAGREKNMTYSESGKSPRPHEGHG